MQHEFTDGCPLLVWPRHSGFIYLLFTALFPSFLDDSSRKMRESLRLSQSLYSSSAAKSDEILTKLLMFADVLPFDYFKISDIRSTFFLSLGSIEYGKIYT